MNLFHLLAMLAPLLLGLVLPLALALGWARPQRWRWAVKTALLVFAAVGALLLIFAMLYGAALGTWLNLALFLLAYGVLVVSVMQLGLLVRMGPATAQIFTSLIVILMVGTVFYFNPIIEAAALEQKQSMVDLAMTMNPWIIIGGPVLGGDPLRARWLYSFSQVGVFNFLYPPWYDVAFMYLAVSLVLFLPRIGWWVWKRISHDSKPLYQTGPVQGPR